MSIFTKVLILFVISLGLMLFVSIQTDKLTQNAIESLLKEKYIRVSDELFKDLANNDTDSLDKKIINLKLHKVKDKKHYFNSSKIIYKYDTYLSTIQIMKHIDNRYLLYLKYLDDDILLIDLSQDKSFKEKQFVNYLILADILILIVLFFIILKLIYPLKNISKSIKSFGNGDYSSRLSISTNDEIGELSTTFNSMASNIEELIISRQRLLRDIGHELKTPITKSKLALEMIENSKYKNLLNKAITQMDNMTNELLDIERLNANRYTLNIKEFDIETLLSEALSKLLLEDEELISINIKSNFKLNADLNYLSIAFKNLIDNALKYSLEKPIYIEVKDKTISIKSKGERLKKPLNYYTQEFTQGDNSRQQEGYGLGLSLVQRILAKHNYTFSYKFENSLNIFVINT